VKVSAGTWATVPVKVTGPTLVFSPCHRCYGDRFALQKGPAHKKVDDVFSRSTGGFDVRSRVRGEVPHKLQTVLVRTRKESLDRIRVAQQGVVARQHTGPGLHHGGIGQGEGLSRRKKADNL